MTMRQRVEDLGRIMVLIDQILDNDLLCYARTSDTIDYITRDIQQAACNIDNVKEKLYECLSITKGDDYLNYNEKVE